MPKLATLLFLTLPVFAGSSPSSITLTSSSNPSTFGKSVTLTARVTPASATGVVTFYSGTTVLETEPLSEGKATLNTIVLPSGTQVLKAYYSGNSSYAPSTSALLTQTVNTVPGYGFQPLIQDAAGTEAEFAAVGDFNGDGKVDLAVAANPGLNVLLGNGDGTFQAPVNYSPGTASDFVAVGDFNGDGTPDLAACSPGTNTISVLLGNGDGTFRAPVDYQVLYAQTLVVGDFNGDGKADLASANSDNVNVSVLLGNGDGSFQSPVYYALSPYPRSIAAADFNGDGKTDLVTADSSGNVVNVFLGNGDGTFQTPLSYPAGPSPGSLAVGDFNADGATDLAVVGDTALSILLGNGDGTFQPPVEYKLQGSVDWVTTGDFNGDGKTDLAILGDYVSVLLGNGDGTFQTPVVYLNSGNTTDTITVGDFNGDGRADLVTSTEGSSVGILLATSALESFTALTSSKNPSTYGQAVTLTATVLPLSATGTISFYSGFAGLGKIALSKGTATLNISTIEGGTNSLTALYSGDATYPASDSPAIIQAVKKASTFTGLTSSPDPSSPGQTVTFKATVSSTTATGTVTFYHGSTALGAGGVSDGIAMLAVSTLTPGMHSITAVYGGDGNYQGSTSPVRVQTVAAATTTTLTSSPNPSNLNQTVTLTATVSPATATGTVTFYHGTTSMGTGSLSNGIATLAVSTLSAGQHSLTAAYGGDANDAPSTSPAIIQTVN